MPLGPAAAVYLIDGSNVARSDAWAEVVRRERGELPHANVDLELDPRGRLADWILSWRTHDGADVVLVFDGEGPQGAGRRQWDHGYLVIGSGSDSGDDVIEAEAVRLARAGRAFRVVTNDRALANVAGARAEAVLSVEAFVVDVTREPEDEPGIEHVNHSHGTMGGEPRPPARLADDLDDDTRAKLERMRRGLDPHG